MNRIEHHMNRQKQGITCQCEFWELNKPKVWYTHRDFSTKMHNCIWQHFKFSSPITLKSIMTSLLQMTNARNAFLWLQLSISNEGKNIIFIHIGFGPTYVKVSTNITVDQVSGILNLFSILLSLIVFIVSLTIFFHLVRRVCSVS